MRRIHVAPKPCDNCGRMIRRFRYPLSLRLEPVALFHARTTCRVCEAIPPKPCKGCKALFSPKVYPGGRRERPSAFAKREFCKVSCRKRRQLRVKHCLQCDDVIRQRRFRGGKLEDRARVRRRRWCNQECRTLWFSDPCNARKWAVVTGLYGAHKPQRKALR